MKQRLRQCILVGIVCFSGFLLPALAQQASGKQPIVEPVDADPISTERPTMGPSSDLLPAGSLQIETGANLSTQGNRYAADLPESLLRVGLSKHWEIRLLAGNLMYQTDHAVRAGRLGAQDLGLSTKVLVSGPNSLLPKSAILNISVPTGGKGMTSGSYDPSLALIWTQTGSRGYFLNEVAQATVTTYYGARRPIWAPSIAGGRSLTAHLTGFAEYAPTPLPDRTVPYTVDGGLAYIAGKLQQFDCRTGYTKDADGLHALISVGYSLRRDSFLPRFH